MSFSEHVIKTPTWVATLVDEVLVACIRPMGFMGQLGYRYWEPDDPTNPSNSWVIVAYPTPNQVCGQSKHDGACFVSGFSFDVGRLLKALNAIDEVVWNSPARHNNNLDGPEISVRGQFAGKHVWLRFFSMPPPDEPPAFNVNPVTSEATELPV